MPCGCDEKSSTEEYNKLLNNPYYIKPEPGIWVFVINSGTPIESSISYSNFTIPEDYAAPGISHWLGRPINWSLCDWQTTFSDPMWTGIPTYIQLINFFFGPTRIPIS